MRKGVDPKGTEPMDIEIPPQPAKSLGERQREQPIKNYGYGSCPICLAEKVALVRTGHHIYWKQHYVMMNSRARPICQATGLRLCESGEGGMAINTPGYAETCGGLHRKENQND